MRYSPTKEATLQPRTLLLEGSWIAIGREVKRVPTPPNIPYIIPEATQEQYAKLVAKGILTNFIVVTDEPAIELLIIESPAPLEIVEVKEEIKNVDIRQPNNKAGTRRRRAVSSIPKV